MTYSVGERVHFVGAGEASDIYEVMGYTEDGRPIIDRLEQSKKVVTTFVRRHQPFACSERMISRSIITNAERELRVADIVKPEDLKRGSKR